jgi:acetylornithine deacetylase/succinyl-diaminopimelate desuccinylase family protein
VPLDLVDSLADLVAIPSVNPMGGSDSGPYYYEDRLAEHLAAILERVGLLVARQHVSAKRPNLLAQLPGEPLPQDGGGLVLLDAHLDTVPVEGMTVDPWMPQIRNGRLYGRGACDVKGGMAAMLHALTRLAEQGPRRHPTVVLSLTVNEEYGFTGARAVAGLWTGGGHPLLPRRPDCALVAEPTALQAVVAHKGVMRWRCHTVGRAAHAATPEAGENAIYRMGEVVRAIDHYQRKVIVTLGAHPLCGPGTVSVGTIRGGVSVNTVPDRCTIEIDRRLRPGETLDEARRHLIDHLGSHLGDPAWIRHDPTYMEGPPLTDEHNVRLADELTALVQEVAGPTRRIAVPYATNGAFFAQTGVPTVVFGPGSIEQAHTADEWIDLRQVEQAAEVYYRFLARD